MELIDSHAHIDFPQFAEDREAMLERAKAVGVKTLVAIGTGPGPEKLDAALHMPNSTSGFTRPSASTRMKRRKSRNPILMSLHVWPGIQKSSLGAKSVSTISTITPLGTFRQRSFVSKWRFPRPQKNQL